MNVNLPSIHISTSYTLDKEVFTSIGHIDLPEEYMDKYEKLVGNGQAKVTVSADMSLKEFGKGTSAMVSVTLTCNQDEETITKAIDLGGLIVRPYCKEQQKLAEEELVAAQQAQNPYKGPFQGK